MLFNRHGEIKLCLVRLKNSKVGHEFKNKADTGNIWLYSQLFCTKAILIQNWMFWCSPWWPVWRNFRAAKPSQARPCSKVCLWVAAVQSVKEVCWLAQIQKISSFILNSREDFCNCPTFRPVNLVPPNVLSPHDSSFATCSVPSEIQPTAENTRILNKKSLSLQLLSFYIW